MSKKHQKAPTPVAVESSGDHEQPPEGESHLVAYARAELERAGLFKEDSDYGGMLGKAVMDLIAQFDGEGHSGMSAGMAISLFTRLAKFQPLTPLTGAEDEWMDVGAEGDNIVWQNKRCGSVFRTTDKAGTVIEAHDIDAECLVDSMDDHWVSTVAKPITFPYSPPSQMKRILRSSVEPSEK